MRPTAAPRTWPYPHRTLAQAGEPVSGDAQTIRVYLERHSRPGPDPRSLGRVTGGEVANPRCLPKGAL